MQIFVVIYLERSNISKNKKGGDFMEDEMHFADVAQIKTINDLLRIDTHRDCIENMDLVGLRQKVTCGDFTIEVEMPTDAAPALKGCLLFYWRK